MLIQDQRDLTSRPIANDLDTSQRGEILDTNMSGIGLLEDTNALQSEGIVRYQSNISNFPTRVRKFDEDSDSDLTDKGGIKGRFGKSSGVECKEESKGMSFKKGSMLSLKGMSMNVDNILASPDNRVRDFNESTVSQGRFGKVVDLKNVLESLEGLEAGK